MTQLSLTNVPGVLVCLLCAAGAHAQSTVIAFGTLDVTLERVGPAAPRGRVSSNSSGFGFRASEDLGAGLRAFFQVEGSLSVDTGVASIGTMTTPLRALGGRLNFVPGGTSVANNMGVMSTLNGMHAGLNSRLSNSSSMPCRHLRRARHDLSLNYSLALGLDCSGNARSGQCAPTAVATTGARQLALLYHYTLSKRTMLLAFYSTIFNEANGRYDYDVNPLGPALAARAPGSHLRALALGIRHSY